MRAFLDDLAFTVRTLRGNIRFAAAVSLVLALGIGANSAIFGILDAVMLRTLPVERPEELVEVSSDERSGSAFTNPIWEALRDRQDVFAGVFAIGNEQFDLAAGGRIDILVQAPQIPDGSIQKYELSGIANLTVCGDPQNDQFPDATNYPAFPAFLGDIPGKIDPDRHLDFGWEPYRIRSGPATNADPSKNVKATHKGPKPIPFPVTVGNARVGTREIIINANRGAYWTIDDEQFNEGKFYQTMILGSDEEWQIWNSTNVPHPFHIHVNPFQIINVVYSSTDQFAEYYAFLNAAAAAGHPVWSDVVPLPVAVIDTTTNDTTYGQVTIRQRYEDFTGQYVMHCHILGHEERGMMQLLQVVPR